MKDGAVGVGAVQLRPAAVQAGDGRDQRKPQAPSAESKGELKPPFKQVKLALPSTEWVIEFQE